MCSSRRQGPLLLSQLRETGRVPSRDGPQKHLPVRSSLFDVQCSILRAVLLISEITSNHHIHCVCSVMRYSPSHPALEGRNLTPGRFLEA